MDAHYYNGDYDLDHPSVEDAPDDYPEPAEGWDDVDQWALCVWWDACFRENRQLLLEMEMGD